MAFPANPNPGDTYTDTYGTIWVYAGAANGWYRQTVLPGNETTYTGGGGSGSATAAGAAGEIQYTDGTNLAASSNLFWDNVNNELEVTGDLQLLDGGTYTTTLQTITPTANRTVSIPDATGTVALVAGSSGQLVYNNAGAYAGASGSSVGATGDITLSLNGAASTPPLKLTGTWFSGGTGTTTTPQLLIDGSATPSTTWSTSGTGLGVNAASGFNGNLLDLQVDGASKANVKSNGDIDCNKLTVGNDINGNRDIYCGNNRYYRFNAGGVTGLGSNALGVVFLQDLGGTNTTPRLAFGGTTSSFASIKGNGVVLESRLADDSAYAQHAASVFEAATAHTVAGLPGTPTVGMIARVADGDSGLTFGQTVVNTGAGNTPYLCWYNGTNWTVIGV